MFHYGLLHGLASKHGVKDIHFMALAALKRIFSRTSGRAELVPLYRAIVAEARTPIWYLDGKVPDTIDGRFDMVGMMMAVVLLRLEQIGDAGKHPSVMLTELFVDDMDGQLREEGMGDVVVGKHIGRMVSALGGRTGAYRDGLAPGGDLDGALIRNVYRGEAPDAAALGYLANRLRWIDHGLAARSLEALLQGKLVG
jgi:cytochrome b pre-mRNA-processing protein 3